MIINTEISVQVVTMDEVRKVRAQTYQCGLSVVEFQKTYTVTHTASGTYIFASSLESECHETIEKIGSMVDWHRPREEVIKNIQLQPVINIIQSTYQRGKT